MSSLKISEAPKEFRTFLTNGDHFGNRNGVLDLVKERDSAVAACAKYSVRLAKEMETYLAGYELADRSQTMSSIVDTKIKKPVMAVWTTKGWKMDGEDDDPGGMAKNEIEVLSYHLIKPDSITIRIYKWTLDVGCLKERVSGQVEEMWKAMLNNGYVDRDGNVTPKYALIDDAREINIPVSFARNVVFDKERLLLSCPEMIDRLGDLFTGSSTSDIETKEGFTRLVEYSDLTKETKDFLKFNWALSAKRSIYNALRTNNTEGNIVRTIGESVSRSVGEQFVYWDGLYDNGKMAEPGTYYCVAFGKTFMAYQTIVIADGLEGSSLGKRGPRNR